MAKLYVVGNILMKRYSDEYYIGHSWPRMDPGFQARGVGDKQRKKFSNTHPYSINKLSTKTNTQKSLFLNKLSTFWNFV